MSVYTADYGYHEGSAYIVEEHKGRDTEASRLRRAVAECIYGMTIRMTGAASYKKRKRLPGAAMAKRRAS